MLVQAGLLVANTILGSKQKKAAAKAQQTAIDNQFAINMSAMRYSLDTLDQRASLAFNQITRDKVRAQMAAEQQGYAAKGKVATQAAIMGTTGKRTELAKVQDIERAVGNAYTDADINAQITSWNLADSVSDQRQSAVNALNGTIPQVSSSGASTLGTIVEGAGSIFNAYQGLDQYQKADLNSGVSKAASTVGSWFGSGGTVGGNSAA